MRIKIDIKKNIIDILKSIWNTFTFTILLIVYLTIKLIESILTIKIFPISFRTFILERFSIIYSYLGKIFDRNKRGTISRLELIRLSIHNMSAKRTRTLVTVGGMTIGIGAIVFLVSIGYGLQELVISRVARLDEMRQTDISVQPGGLMKINDETLTKLKDINYVEDALPLISVVGRVNYQSSVSDMAVYGVTSEYLKQSAIKPVKGEIFSSNEISIPVVEPKTETVKGVSISDLDEVVYKIEPETWIEVYEKPNGKLIGYTKRVEGISYGQEVTDNEKVYIKGIVYIWEYKDEKYIEKKDSEGIQIQNIGYLERNKGISTQAFSNSYGQVLGASSILPWVEVSEESESGSVYQLKKVELPKDVERVAVVNRSMLQVLNITEEEAVGKTFEVSFVVIGDLLNNQIEKIESTATSYKIVGVIPDDKTPVFYVPFIDLRSLGINNYSQVKVVVNNSENLEFVRDNVEAMGYITRSVADTVSQIKSLFTTFRSLLALVGMVALGVASLGMFNTLTVSLLERTREVGLMKAMGMKPSEVSELFLTESMIMGFIGGIMGLFTGWLLGRILSILLSSFSIIRGSGTIDISYIPISFILLILGLSLVVGLGTGIFPARRVRKISALNALRYE